jgi:hypothetical protein
MGHSADLIGILDPIVQISEFIKQLVAFIIHFQRLFFDIKESLLRRIQVFRQSVFCQTACKFAPEQRRWTYRVLYARPNSLCRYSSIELVKVAGIAIASHLAKLARNRCGRFVTNVETILFISRLQTLGVPSIQISYV